jgi:hypothetical protein
MGHTRRTASQKHSNILVQNVSEMGQAFGDASDSNWKKRR